MPVKPQVVSLTSKVPVETSNRVPIAFPFASRVTVTLVVLTLNPTSAGEGERVAVETVAVKAPGLPVRSKERARK